MKDGAVRQNFGRGLHKEEISFIDPILFILFQLILVVFVERI
jgi:hypothetical protein